MVPEADNGVTEGEQGVPEAGLGVAVHSEQMAIRHSLCDFATQAKSLITLPEVMS